MTCPVGASVKPSGWFIQELTATTEKAPPSPEITTGTPGPEVRPPGEALPAEDVDRDEDRLEEEEDALDRERDPEDLAEAARELRPQEAELERQHRAGDGAHGERHRRHLRPALRELQRVGVVAAQAEVVGDQHHRREGDAEAGEDDVEARA